MLTFEEVVEATGGEPRGTHSRSLRFSSVAIDSRQVQPGGLFVALAGERHDGHTFVAEILAGNAAGAVVERVPPGCDWADEPGGEGPPLVLVPSTREALQQMARFQLARHPKVDVVGITGSLGKTTTKEVAAGVLAPRRRVLKSEGNLNSEIGLPLVVLNGLRSDHEVAVLEMGMYDVGDIRLLARIARPRIGVVTSVQPVHLERLGTIERIQQAKQELVEELPANGVAVLNADDPRVTAMAAATGARIVRYGLAPDAHVRAERVHSQGLRGIDFDLIADETRLSVHAPLLGAHSVQAALAATAIALEEGLTLADVAEALQALTPTLRLVVLEGINGSRILDDSYNASPESVLAALDLLGELPGPRKIAVLGDMLELGSEEVPGHQRVGDRAARVADVLVTYGDRARVIAAAARTAGMRPERVIESRSLEEIADFLGSTLRRGDEVLVKGSRAMGLDAVVKAIRAEAQE